MENNSDADVDTDAFRNISDLQSVNDDIDYQQCPSGTDMAESEVDLDGPINITGIVSGHPVAG